MKRRTLEEISNAEEKFYERVWLERHLCIKDDYLNFYLNSDDSKFVKIAKDALESEKRIKEKYKDDPDFETPCTDFEWGMINGKLSALRWVLGLEWDTLDT